MNPERFCLKRIHLIYFSMKLITYDNLEQKLTICKRPLKLDYLVILLVYDPLQILIKILTNCKFPVFRSIINKLTKSLQHFCIIPMHGCSIQKKGWNILDVPFKKDGKSWMFHSKRMENPGCSIQKKDGTSRMFHSKKGWTIPQNLCKFFHLTKHFSCDCTFRANITRSNP